MKNIIAIVPLALLVACAPKPQLYATTLPQDDPKWETEDCKQIRIAALNYDDKVGQRLAIGVASGLLLGPFGLPLAIAADANQDEQRKMFSRELHMRCSSRPLPENLRVDKTPAADQVAHGMPGN